VIRTLALIAAAGFVLCIGSLAGALALAGGAAGLKDRVTQFAKEADYDQDTLEIDLGGAGRVTAAGKTRRVVLDISGTGAADLTALEVEEAEVDLSGAGKATLGPKSSARIDVSGIGEIELTRRPARLEQNISGAGRVSQPGLPG